MTKENLVWQTDLLEQLQKQNITVNTSVMENAVVWEISSKYWCLFAEQADLQSLRWVSGWGDECEDVFLLNAVFEKQGQYICLRTSVIEEKMELPSQATVYPAAIRSERHTHDLLGIHFNGHRDKRAWLRHKAWKKHEYPLRRAFPLEGEPKEVTSPDMDYQFVKARGVGTYEIPVGPIHAGIIEAGHFRFQAVGETILNLEERLGYMHKGIEKLAVGKEPEQLSRLAGRVSGDSTVAHSWAACRAMEEAAGIVITPRAALIRGILLERERVANHLGDVGAIANDVAFAFAQMQFSRLRELWLRANKQYFGHRLLMDCIVPGGVTFDLTDHSRKHMSGELEKLSKEMGEILPANDFNSSLEDRFVTTGRLSKKTAEAYGAVGYVARASGLDVDVRRDAPYAPYDTLTFKVALETLGDVSSRVLVRVKEIFSSMKLIKQMLEELSEGEIRTDWKAPPANSEGLAMIEGWRGEIVTYVRFTKDNKVSRFYPRDPSMVNWPTLEKIVLNNIVADFPVCNKSLNGSYSGHDL
jgi:Ni,Fe-hydrogenase III large subunit/Ni,Fe-hydrogenase III component G